MHQMWLRKRSSRTVRFEYTVFTKSHCLNQLKSECWDNISCVQQTIFSTSEFIIENADFLRYHTRSAGILLTIDYWSRFLSRSRSHMNCIIFLRESRYDTITHFLVCKIIQYINIKYATTNGPIYACIYINMIIWRKLLRWESDFVMS